MRADFSLYQHQKRGIEFLLNNTVGVLGDEMGLGKTLQTIIACRQLLQQGAVEEIVIVCPRSLKLNWQSEIKKFTDTPDSDIVVVEGVREVRQRQLLLPRKWLIINYEVLRIESEQLLSWQRAKKFVMVCDESHRIKNRNSKQAKVCLQLGGYALRRYLLSGTFVANKPEDIWNQINFLDNGEMLGSFYRFKRDYCITRLMHFGRKRVERIVAYRNLEKLKAKISLVMLRRTKEQCLDLPQKIVQKIPVLMTNKQKKLYKHICDDIVANWQSVVVNPNNVLNRMTYAIAVASNPALVNPEAKADKLTHLLQEKPHDKNLQMQLRFWQQLQALSAEESGKLQALDDMLDLYCAEEKRKVILWSFFVGNIELFYQRYAKYQPVVFYGQSTSNQRIHALEKFNNDKDCLLFIANPQAAGFGLNLISSSLCIFFDRNFSAVDYQQAVDRVHRIGQTQTCNILLLQAQHSIDKYIDDLQNSKSKMSAYLQEEAEAILLGKSLPTSISQ